MRVRSYLLACSQLCSRRLLGNISGLVAFFIGALRFALAENVAPFVGRHGRDHSGTISDGCGRNGEWAITPSDTRS